MTMTMIAARPSPRTSLIACIPMAMALAMGSGCLQDIDPGELETLERQPTSRFPLGSTFYLPLPAESRWVLVSGPQGNDNEVVAGSDGFARFTPVVAGDYEFRISGTGERRSLTVVDEVPYEHFNYYTTHSLARVGDEVWVAHGFDPHVSRIDPATGQVVGTLAVGPWPSAIAWQPELSHALVAHTAGDTVGFVDVEAGRLVDAVWVGDEPSSIVLSPDGATAYVSLATQSEVAVIDVARREVTSRIATNPDPGAMALSADGSTLYVASYRSGVSDRLQFPSDPRNDLYDIGVVDTASGELRGHVTAVGSTIGGLLLDGERLYVATTRVAIEELSTQEGMTAFRHTVAAYDVGTLAEVAAVDLGRQPSSSGFAVRPFGMALSGGTLWVTVEGSDAVVGLDPASLAETARFAAEGRPRTILADEGRLYVHGAQAYRVTLAEDSGTVTGSVALTGDPRPAGVAQGQRLYTGTGSGAGENHSCADCHVDGLTDGNVWSAGFSESTSRPMFWLEGTTPIGWEGDAPELFSYLWGSPGPTIGTIIDTEGHQAFYDYLAALVPPPPANGLTLRDGSPSEDAVRGEALFSGAGACTSCHAGPLTTQGLRLPNGGTQDDHPIVVPSLVGAYRHTFWLVNGAARTLEEAVDAMLPLSGGALDEGEIADVARYLGELTARELFVLSSTPQAGSQHVRSEGPLSLTLSHPVLDDPENLARITLRAAGGEAVSLTVEADARHLTLTPAAALVPGQAYELVVPAELEGFNEQTLGAEEIIAFTVAGAPSLRLEGDYVVTIDHPNLDRENNRYDDSVIIPVQVSMQATPTPYGAALLAQTTDILEGRYDVVIEGDQGYFPPFAFPVGPPGFLNRSFPTEIVLRDEDGDGIADSGESTLYLRSPGLEALDVRWTIARDTGEPVDCSGMEGMNEVTLSMDDAGAPVVEWSADVTALGYYVTDPDATPPAGPGPVTGGETYWAVSTASFPTGFEGPVRYGEVPAGGQDVSEDSGAPLGGAPLPAGECIKLTLVFSDFSSTVLRYVAP